jgi:hypothetical protein
VRYLFRQGNDPDGPLRSIDLGDDARPPAVGESYELRTGPDWEATKWRVRSIEPSPQVGYDGLVILAPVRGPASASHRARVVRLAIAQLVVYVAIALPGAPSFPGRSAVAVDIVVDAVLIALLWRARRGFRIAWWVSLFRTAGPVVGLAVASGRYGPHTGYAAVSLASLAAMVALLGLWTPRVGEFV